MESAELNFKVNDETYNFRLEDITASESGDFRKALGFPISSAFADGMVDLDSIAGLVWLIRRRSAKGLAYQQVADSITYGSFEIVEDVEEDPNSPEA